MPRHVTPSSGAGKLQAGSIFLPEPSALFFSLLCCRPGFLAPGTVYSI